MFHEKQGELGDLAKKSTFEIKELIQRQEKLLSKSGNPTPKIFGIECTKCRLEFQSALSAALMEHRSFLKNLPDRGAKVLAFTDKLKAILAERDDVDGAARLFDTLSLSTKEDPSNQGGEPSGVTEKNRVLHSNIFARPVEANTLKFRPNMTLASLKSSESREAQRIAGNKREQDTTRRWDVTAAYSVPLRNEALKPVDLTESLTLQLAQQKQMERLRAEQATEKLAERLGISVGEFTIDVETASSFRDPSGQLDSEDENEVAGMEREESLDGD